jgi:hypothetical protein
MIDRASIRVHNIYPADVLNLCRIHHNSNSAHFDEETFGSSDFICNWTSDIYKPATTLYYKFNQVEFMSIMLLGFDLYLMGPFRLVDLKGNPRTVT